MNERQFDFEKGAVWKAYCKFLVEWATNHSDTKHYGETPASFDEWFDNERLTNNDSGEVL